MTEPTTPNEPIPRDLWSRHRDGVWHWLKDCVKRGYGRESACGRCYFSDTPPCVPGCGIRGGIICSYCLRVERDQAARGVVAVAAAAEKGQEGA